jgi:hypothetical protein
MLDFMQVTQNDILKEKNIFIIFSGVTLFLLCYMQGGITFVFPFPQNIID